MCLAAALAVAALTGLAIAGLDSAAAEAEAINSDEVVHAMLDGAVRACRRPTPSSTGSDPRPGRGHVELSQELYQQQIPRVRGTARGRTPASSRVTASDERRATSTWLDRGLDGDAEPCSTDPRLTPRPAMPTVAEELRKPSSRSSATSRRWWTDEAADAGPRNEATSTPWSRQWRLWAWPWHAVAAPRGAGRLGNRRIRREIEPVKEQVEFADTAAAHRERGGRAPPAPAPPAPRRRRTAS